MYIRGLIPRNFAELDESVPIAFISLSAADRGITAPVAKLIRGMISVSPLSFVNGLESIPDQTFPKASAHLIHLVVF